MFALIARMDTAGSAILAFRERTAARWTIGHADSPATWRFRLGMASEAAVIVRSSEGYVWNGEPIGDGQVRSLPGLAVRFRQPHPWTPTAVLERLDGPRAVDGTESLVLASGPVLFGGEGAHLAARGAGETIALFRPDEAASDPEMTLAWKLVSGPLDSHPVNRIAPPTFIETDTLRLTLDPV